MARQRAAPCNRSIRWMDSLAFLCTDGIRPQAGSVLILCDGILVGSLGSPERHKAAALAKMSALRVGWLAYCTAIGSVREKERGGGSGAAGQRGRGQEGAGRGREGKGRGDGDGDGKG